MNSVQSYLYRVICAIAEIRDFDSIVKESAVRYGFLNYIAKYSLANDRYFVTEISLRHLKSRGYLNDSGLRRGLKSKANGFTFEHPVPANVVAEQIIIYRDAPEMIRLILERTDCIYVLTSEENYKLNGGLVNSMPDGWDFFNDNILARYEASGIISSGSMQSKIDVYGSIKR